MASHACRPAAEVRLPCSEDLEHEQGRTRAHWAWACPLDPTTVRATAPSSQALHTGRCWSADL